MPSAAFRQVSQTQQLQEAQLKEFQATKKIECMLGGPSAFIETDKVNYGMVIYQLSLDSHDT